MYGNIPKHLELNFTLTFWIQPKKYIFIKLLWIKLWPILRYVTFIKLGNAPILEQFCKTLPEMGGTKLTDTSWISISHLSDDTSEMVQITEFARFM